MSSPTCFEIITTLSALGAAFAGLWAAWSASKAAHATKILVDAQTGPYVNVYITPRADEPDMAAWVIENCGFSTAKNITFEFESEPYGILDTKTDTHHNIPEKHPFRNGLKTLPAKCIQTYNINIWPKLEAKTFTIKWRYENEHGNIYHSEFTWDNFKKSGMTIPTPPLTRIARSIENIEDIVAPKKSAQ